MKRSLVMVCLSGSTASAQPAVHAEPEPASETGAFAAARLGMQATRTSFGDGGKSPVLELELGHRQESWLAFSLAASVTGFDGVALDANQQMLATTTRLYDGRARVTFTLADPATAARARYSAGIGFGVLHTQRDALADDSRTGPLGELFLGLDRALGRHVSVTVSAGVAMGAGFLGRVCAGVELY